MILDVGHAAAAWPSHLGQAQQSDGNCYSVVPHWVTGAQLAEKGRLFVLASAFDGQEAGESCRHAVNRLYQLYYSHPSSDIRQGLQQAIQRVNNELYDEARRRQSSKSVMMLAAVLYRNGLHIANIGRVRAYLWHKGYLRQLTTDHPVEEVVPTADCPPEAGESEKAKNLPENQRPTRSLGNSRQLLIDFSWQRFTLGDKLLLCTDGFYQLAQGDEIAPCLQEDKVQDAANRLINLVQDRDDANNASVLLIAARSKGTETPAIPIMASRLFWGAVGGGNPGGSCCLGHMARAAVRVGTDAHSIADRDFDTQSCHLAGGAAPDAHSLARDGDRYSSADSHGAAADQHALAADGHFHSADAGSSI